MRITAEPRSDQWNADDFVAGPRTFTIAGVIPGKAEQKYDIQLVEGEGRVWRPPLTVLRLLMHAWGDDSTLWHGRQVTLYLDESVTFGKDKVGGIRVSHLSHIERPLTLALTEKRGRKATHTALPLPSAPSAPAVTAEMVAACADVAELQRMWGAADESLRPVIEARAAALKAGSDGS